MRLSALDCDVDIRMMLLHNPSLPGEVNSIFLIDLKGAIRSCAKDRFAHEEDKGSPP